MMAKYFSDDKGRYVSIDNFTKDIYLGRFGSNSYGNPGYIVYILDLIKSIITSDKAEHHYCIEDGCSEVILGSLRISISTTEIYINGNVDTRLYSPSDFSRTMRYFNEFLDYFNNGR